MDPYQTVFFVFLLIRFLAADTQSKSGFHVQAEPRDDSKVYLKWDFEPSRYKIFVYKDDLIDPIEWPCQYEEIEMGKQFEEELYSIKAETEFDCVNRCIDDVQCTGVTNAYLSSNTQNCVLKQNSNTIELTVTDSKAFKIKDEAYETMVVDLPYGHKYKFKVSIYINSNWDSISDESNEIDMTIKMEFSGKRLGFKKYELNWNQMESSYSITTYLLFVNNVNDAQFQSQMLLKHQTVNELYYEYLGSGALFDNANPPTTTSLDACRGLCINFSRLKRCVRYIWLNETVHGYAARKCLFQNRFLKNNATQKHKGASVQSLKNTMNSYIFEKQSFDTYELMLTYLTPFGSEFNSNLTIDLMNNIYPHSLRITENMKHNLSVTLEWLVNNPDNVSLTTFINKTENNTQSTIKLNGTSNSIIISSLYFNTDYKFSAYFTDQFDVSSNPSNQESINTEFVVELKESTLNYIVNESANLTCEYTEINEDLKREIKWYKNGNMIGEYTNSTYLEFKRLSQSDSGNYKCQVELINGQTMPSQNITILVILIPRVKYANQTSFNSVEIYLDEIDSNLNVTRYQVMLSTDDFNQDIRYWPALAKKEDREYSGTTIGTVNKNSYFDCFNECISVIRCAGVTAKGPGIISCVLKRALTSSSATLSTNHEFRRIESITNADKIVLNNLPFNEKYKFKVSLLQNNLSKDFSVKGLKINYTTVGIKKHEISWLQEGTFTNYPISKYTMINNSTVAMTLNGEFTTFNLEPSYFEKLIQSDSIFALSDSDCSIKCDSSPDCVQYLYAKNNVTISGQNILKSSCFLKNTFNVFNGNGIEIPLTYDKQKCIKSNLIKYSFDVDEALSVNIRCISPFGTTSDSNQTVISKPKPLIPLLRNSSDTLDVTVELSWRFDQSLNYALNRFAILYAVNNTNQILKSNVYQFYFYDSIISMGNLNVEDDSSVKFLNSCYSQCFDNTNCNQFAINFNKQQLQCLTITDEDLSSCKDDLTCISISKFETQTNVTRLTLNTEYCFKMLVQDNYGEKSEYSEEICSIFPMKVDLRKNTTQFVEGNKAYLTCNFTEIHSKYIKSINWYKNNEAKFDTTNITYSEDNKTLTFDSLNHEYHNGVYKCVLNTNKTKEQSFESQEFNLTIEFGPFLAFDISFNSTLEFNEIENITNFSFNCTVEGYETPHISMIFKNTTLTNATLSNEKFSRTIVYTYSKLRREHNGTYTCRVNGNEEISKSLDIIVYYPFTVEKPPDISDTNNVIADYNTSCTECKIKVPCGINGYASKLPKTTWKYKINEEYDVSVNEAFINRTNDSTSYTSFLIFEEMKREYNGIYKCFVEDTLSKTDEFKFEVRIIIRSRPSGLIITSSDIYSDRTEIEFALNDYGDLNLTYAVVEWSLTENFTEPDSKRIDFLANLTKISLNSQLEKNSFVRIQVSNELGSSEMSELKQTVCKHNKCETTINTEIILAVVFSIFGVVLIVLVIVGYKKRETIKKWRKPGTKYQHAQPIPEHSISTFINERWSKNIEATENELIQEYSKIQNPKDLPSDEALKPCNKISKNRFKDIRPYDYNRVRLKTSSEDAEGSDYINASFVEGFGKTLKFIAAQGPKEETIEDFWKMVFENKVQAIVMLTKSIEMNKVKCFEYWNDVNEMQFDYLTVKVTACEYNLNYVKRKFLVKSENTSDAILIVDQYHYVNWPDHGVPEDTQTIVSLIDRVNKEHGSKDWPILVHCSAGVGRTGTYIALDILLEALRANSEIDVNECVKELRKQRMLLVQTKEQYLFIFRTLVEHYTFGNTTMHRSTCQNTYKTFLKSNKILADTTIGIQFQNIVKVPNSYQPTNVFHQYLDKFKSTVFIPYDPMLIKLTRTEQDQSTIYLDASYFSSPQLHTSFHIASNPTEENGFDLLRLIYEYRPNFIVAFAKPFFLPQPNATYTTQDNFISFKNHGETTINGLSCHKLEYMVPQTNESFFITLFDHSLNWPENKKLPINNQTFINFVGSMLSTIKPKDRNLNMQALLTLVISNDAGDQCGVFIALLLLLNSIQEYKRFDVVQVVRMLRQCRSNMIRSVEIYNYLYEICCGDLKGFDVNSNQTDPLHSNEIIYSNEIYLS